MSNDATSMYSTWFSIEDRGYCDRSRRGERTCGFKVALPAAMVVLFAEDDPSDGLVWPLPLPLPLLYADE